MNIIDKTKLYAIECDRLSTLRCKIMDYDNLFMKVYDYEDSVIYIFPICKIEYITFLKIDKIKEIIEDKYNDICDYIDKSEREELKKRRKELKGALAIAESDKRGGLSVKCKTC